MLTAVFALLAAAQERPDLVLSGELLPPGAVARFGIPHAADANGRHLFAVGCSDEGSFRVAVPDGKDVRVWAWHARGAQPPKHLFRGLPADVTRLALSPDGRTLAAGDKGGDIRVWDLATGDELLAVDEEPSDGVLAVSARGRFVFRAGKGSWAVWETTTKKRLAFGPDKQTFITACFSPDGKLLVTADKEGKLELWEPRTRKRLGELAWAPPSPPKPEKEPAFKLPKIGRAPTGLFESVDPPSPEHDGGVIRIAFSADGKRVIAAGASVVRAWDAETRKELWRVSHSRYFTTVGGATAWTHDSGKLSGADISPDGKLVATTDVSGTLHLIDGATGKDLWMKNGICRDLYRKGILGVAFHPNGKWLATFAAGNRADLWDIRTGARLASTGGHPGAVGGLAFSPDGKYLASLGRDDSYIDLYDLAARRAVARASARAGHGHGFGFTANGKYLVTGAAYSGAYSVAEFTPGARPALRMFHERGSFGSADATCIDPRAPARVVVVWYNQAIHGVDIPSGKWINYGDGTQKTLIQPNDRYYHIALAPDAERLLIGTGSYYDRPARVYDLKSGKEAVKLEDNAPASDVAITPDGKLIAGVANVYRGVHKREFRVWDGTTGKRKFMIDYGENQHGSPPAFTPDGRRVAIGIGNEVILYDVATAKKAVRMKAHRGIVWRIAFSPDGKWMASSGGDGQTLLWEVEKLPTLKP